MCFHVKCLRKGGEERGGEKKRKLDECSVCVCVCVCPCMCVCEEEKASGKEENVNVRSEKTCLKYRVLQGHKHIFTCMFSHICTSHTQMVNSFKYTVN